MNRTASRVIPIRLISLLAAFCVLPLACCKRDAASDAPAASSSVAESDAAGPATHATAPTTSATAAPSGDRASRKAEYCKRHDALKGLLTPKCQQCLTSNPKAKTLCEAHANAKKACEKKVPGARIKEGLACMVGCGVQCTCSLACYEKSMPECIEPYLTTVACVESACQDSCK